MSLTLNGWEEIETIKSNFCFAVSRGHKTSSRLVSRKSPRRQRKKTKINWKHAKKNERANSVFRLTEWNTQKSRTTHARNSTINEQPINGRHGSLERLLDYYYYYYCEISIIVYIWCWWLRLLRLLYDLCMLWIIETFVIFTSICITLVDNGIPAARWECFRAWCVHYTGCTWREVLVFLAVWQLLLLLLGLRFFVAFFLIDAPRIKTHLKIAPCAHAISWDLWLACTTSQAVSICELWSAMCVCGTNA